MRMPTPPPSVVHQATSGGNPAHLVVLQRQAVSPTKLLEHLLLFAMIVLTPLEDHLPAIGGRSVLFLVFVLLALYVILMRPWAFVATWRHPVFLAGYGWLGLSSLLESLQPHTSYSEPVRMAQMLLGGVFVACLCRDRQALRVGMYGYIIAGLWLAILLFLTTYGALESTHADTFQEASRVRAEVFQDQSLEINLNRAAFYVSQGAAVALVMALSTPAVLGHIVFLGLTGVCLIATFLPLSRSGIIVAIVACATVTLSYGIARSGERFNRFLKIFLLALVLGGCILTFVPPAVFARFAFPQTYASGQAEARAEVYTASLQHLPDYIVTGVGAGNFWGPWGAHSHFTWQDGSMHGAHNGLIQITIYWGVGSLLAFCLLLYLAYRCLPRHCGTEGLSLGLLGISAGLGLYLMVTHEVAFKGFSLGLGLLVGSRRWIWPRGIVSATPALHLAHQQHLSSDR